ncbi:MAG: DUF3857 domain-containing protein [bacterium]|nr:DUF3857 domain-containing protein [bacterium]
MRTFAVLLFITLTVIIMSPSNLTFAGEKGPEFGKVTDAEWQLSFPPKYPEANAIIVFDRCSLMVGPPSEGSGIEIRRHVRMKILRPAGAEEIGEVEIPYRDGDRLKDVKAQTIRPDGTVTKVEGKDFFEKTVEDWKVRTFSFPAADSGCIVEYTYRNFNNRYYYLKPWDFQTDIYTLESRFALTLYPGFTYSSSYSNVPVTKRDPVVTESVAPGDIFTTLKCFVWRMENLPPLVDEPYGGVEADYQSSLNYQLVSYKYPKSGYIEKYIEGWEDLGEKQDKFLRDYYSNGKVKPLLEPLIAGITDPLEKTRRIYQYVTANYAAKADPVGYWLSHDNLNQMLKEGYGTPEEKNLMLVHMLREAGIQSWPVEISTRDHKRFNPEVFQIQQFNHVICYAQLDDSSGIYMDATTKYCPFGMLPPNSLVEGGFLIDGKKSQLVRVFYTDRRTYRLDETYADRQSWRGALFHHVQYDRLSGIQFWTVE